MKGFKGKLENGDEVFIPNWPVDVAIENLAKAGKYLGTQELIEISKKNQTAVLVALSNSGDPENAAGLFSHFCSAARINGDKMSAVTISERYTGDLKTAAELFALVVHVQYADFFDLGLAKATSQQP
jgi:hypothetical protein